jgi:hypothetical protein
MRLQDNRTMGDVWNRLNTLALTAFALMALMPAHVAPVCAQSSGAAADPQLPRARFHHLHMNTVDPEAPIAFYTSRFTSAAGHFAGQPALSVNGMWFLFNTRTLARLKNDGVAILEPPQVILNGTLRSAFVQAPDNVQVELVELKK